ncbi:MAG TPA: hypothetical protein VGK30_18665 [Candidatus Binatia bacterium]|jgi:hypothetical protein
MYFVTSKKAGYVLFCMTPSGRAAIGLTESQKVHLFEREGSGEWKVLKEWDAAEHSHTDIMIRLGECEEPADPKRLLDLVAAP